MRFLSKKNQKLKSRNGGEKETSVFEDNISIPMRSSHNLAESQPSAQGNCNKYNFKDHINLQCCNLTERFTGASSATFTHDETSIVKESPYLDICSDAVSSDYSKDDNSDSTIIEASAGSAMGRLSSFRASSTTGSKISITVTPEKCVTANNIRETELSLNMSVNSHNPKRRKPMVIPFINLMEEENTTSCVSTPTWYTKSSLEVRDATNGSESNFGKILNSQSPQLPTSNLPGSCSLTVPLLDKRLQLFCSLCKNPLGRHENHQYLTCSLISSSKVHLGFLLKERLENYTASTEKSVPVFVTDSSFVDQRICNRKPTDTQEQGIWCPEDGCVFSPIFCPFCSNTNNLLGVQIMATNSSNVQLLDKILFFFDSLEVKNHEETGKNASEEVSFLPVINSGIDGVAALNSFEKYSYVPQPGKSEVWNARKSKPRLRGVL
ncbi:hypothetical protein KIW84_060011 [Lathyrus oleraceus]|nr:hypothetical protein KIW84_060011 [Pisum sativum]